MPDGLGGHMVQVHHVAHASIATGLLWSLPAPLTSAEVSLGTVNAVWMLGRLVEAIPTLKDAVVAISEPRSDMRFAESEKG